MATEGLLAALEAAVGALEGAGLGYALIGGAALPAWGRMRATADADVLLSSEPEALAAAVRALREAGFAHMERADRRQIEDKTVLHFWFPLRDVGVSVRVDLIAVDEASYGEVLARAVARQVDGFRVRIASCEDLILLKLAAGRAIDVADARELCAINRDELDLEYLEERARRRGLQQLLDEVRRPSPPG